MEYGNPLLTFVVCAFSFVAGLAMTTCLQVAF
jgi:hypothetical protein